MSGKVRELPDAHARQVYDEDALAEIEARVCAAGDVQFENPYHIHRAPKPVKGDSSFHVCDAAHCAPRASYTFRGLGLPSLRQREFDGGYRTQLGGDCPLGHLPVVSYNHR